MDDKVVAWRVFGLGTDGVLYAPFSPLYWPNAPAPLRLWSSVHQKAGCVVQDHPAPAEGCTCGIRGVVDRNMLLAAATTRHIPGAENMVMAEAGVIGQVRLSGRMLPGVNIPLDDPPTTLRAESAEVTELHLGPVHAGVAAQVAAHYDVPVLAYDENAWSGFVPEWVEVEAAHRVEPASEETFLADVRRIGLGTKDLGDPDADEVILSLGKLVCRALREGVSLNDVLSVVFHSPAQPTFGQAQAVHDSAVRNLCPECRYAFGSDDYHYARPVTMRANIDRMFKNLAADVLSTAFPRQR